jgi:hypothetical protein
VFRAGVLAGCIAGAAIGVITSAAPAVADWDWKSYAGAECVQRTSSTGTIGYGQEGNAYNAHSTNDLRVICPVIADVRNGSVWEPNHTYFSVDVYDGNDGKSVDCWFNVADGTTVVFQTYDSTSVSGTGASTLDAFDFAADRAMLAYYECILPDQDVTYSRVYAYTAEEYYP